MVALTYAVARLPEARRRPPFSETRPTAPHERRTWSPAERRATYGGERSPTMNARSPRCSLVTRTSDAERKRGCFNPAAKV
jgi:hypothetical protein